MTQRRVRQAFEVPLKTWASAQVPPVPVAWENSTFKPPAGRYLRAYLLPADTASYDLLGKHRCYRGIFQLTLCLPLQTGMKAAEVMAEAIGALYPVNTAIVVDDLRVYPVSPMSTARAIPEDDCISLPLSCRYEAHDVVT